MAVNTPKTKIPAELLNLKTPEEPIQQAWDPRSPLQNRTPINLIEPADSPSVCTPNAVTNPKDLKELDPRSPLLDGNRTPVPLDVSESDLSVEVEKKNEPRKKEEKKEEEKEDKKKNEDKKKEEKKDENKDDKKDGKGRKKKKVTVTQEKKIKRIAFNDTTNVVDS